MQDNWTLILRAVNFILEVQLPIIVIHRRHASRLLQTISVLPRRVVPNAITRDIKVFLLQSAVYSLDFDAN